MDHPDPQARALERDRAGLHRGPHDARPAGRRGPRQAHETAERIATLGGTPCETPGALVAQRDWDDYSIGRSGTQEHLGALDLVYAEIIEAHRRAIDAAEDLDLVTQDMLIGQYRQLEQFHWSVRAHVETPGGSLVTGNTSTEKTAAERAETPRAKKR